MSDNADGVPAYGSEAVAYGGDGIAGMIAGAQMGDQWVPPMLFDDDGAENSFESQGAGAWEKAVFGGGQMPLAPSYDGDGLDETGAEPAGTEADAMEEADDGAADARGQFYPAGVPTDYEYDLDENGEPLIDRDTKSLLDFYPNQDKDQWMQGISSALAGLVMGNAADAGGNAADAGGGAGGDAGRSREAGPDEIEAFPNPDGWPTVADGWPENGPMGGTNPPRVGTVQGHPSWDMSAIAADAADADESAGSFWDQLLGDDGDTILQSLDQIRTGEPAAGESPTNGDQGAAVAPETGAQARPPAATAAEGAAEAPSDADWGDVTMPRMSGLGSVLGQMAWLKQKSSKGDAAAKQPPAPEHGGIIGVDGRGRAVEMIPNETSDGELSCEAGATADDRAVDGEVGGAPLECEEGGGGLADEPSLGETADGGASEGSRRRRLAAGVPKSEAAWLNEWRRRLACWYVGLPIPTQTQLGSCMGGLSISLASQLDVAWRTAQSLSGHAPPPRGESATESATEGCEWLTQGRHLDLPAFPELSPDLFKLGLPPIPRLRELISDIWGKRGATYGEKGGGLPPIPRLVPTWQQLQSHVGTPSLMSTRPLNKGALRPGLSIEAIHQGELSEADAPTGGKRLMLSAALGFGAGAGLVTAAVFFFIAHSMQQRRNQRASKTSRARLQLRPRVAPQG